MMPGGGYCVIPRHFCAVNEEKRRKLHMAFFLQLLKLPSTLTAMVFHLSNNKIPSNWYQ